MRNKFGGDCYKCGLLVAVGTGHFERHKGRWRTQHGLHSGQGRMTCNEAAAKVVNKGNARMKLKHIKIWVCQYCLDGKGEECHTPGCSLYLHRVDLPIAPELYEVIKEVDHEQFP